MAMNPRLLRPLASGFSPKSIAGLEAWYAADVASSITLATGVQQWADLSGNSRHLIQNTTNNQPAYNSVSLNGKPAVTFDGVNDSLRTANFSLPQPFHFFAVYRFESAYVSGAPRFIDAGLSPTRSGECFRQNTNDIRLFAGATLTGNLVPAGEVEQFNVWDILFNGASSAIRFRKDVYAVTGNAGANNAGRLTMAGDLNATASSNANVSFAELLVYSRDVPVAEADKIRSYLGKKYNLAYQS